jgi:8-oxo-dGTP diphosphatase
MLTVDIVVFSYLGSVLHTLLIKRKNDPHKDRWAFPGGFVDEDETAERAAIRELKEETGITKIHLEQVFTESELNRDPRGRTVSIVFRGLLKPDQTTSIQGGDDAKEAIFFPVKQLPELAFDHNKIFGKAFNYIKEAAIFKPFGKNLLPDKFHLSDLKKIVFQFVGDEKISNSIVNRMIEFKVVKHKPNANQWEFDNIKYIWYMTFGFFHP